MFSGVLMFMLTRARDKSRRAVRLLPGPGRRLRPALQVLLAGSNGLGRFLELRRRGGLGLGRELAESSGVKNGEVG